MTFFNRPLSSLIAIACSGALLVACDGKRGHMEDATFRVENVSLEKTDVKKVDVSGLQQTKEFFFKACITDSDSREAISISRFAVSDGKTSRSILTDSGGCLEWREIHTIHELQNKRSLRMERTFTSEEVYKGAVTVSLSFNPWDQTLVDLRKTADPDLAPQEETMVGFDMNLQQQTQIGVDPFSETAMDDVKLTFQGHDIRATEITPLLTLKPAQRFRLSVRPQILRRNVKNEVSYMDLKGGEFKISLVVLADNGSLTPTSADIVAYSNATIEVQPKGLAQKDITVRIHDVSSVLSRNKFYLVMQPLGPTASLARPAVYQGFVGPLAGNDAAVDLIPYEGDESGFIRSIETSVADLNRPVNAMEVFQANSGLSFKPELKVFAESAFEKNDAKNGERIAQLCAMLYGANETTTEKKSGWFGRAKNITVNLRSACARSPQEFLSLEKRELVQEILGKPRYQPELVSSKSISLSRDLKYAKVQASEHKRGWERGFGGSASIDFSLLGILGSLTGIKIPLVSDGFKANIGGSWMKSSGVTVGDSVEIGTSISESQVLSVDSVGYEVDVRVHAYALLIPLKGEGKKGFYACSDKTTDKTTTETFYQLNHSVANSVFSDALSESGTMWRVLIRGRENYAQFEELMTKGNGVLQMSLMKFEDPRAPLLPDFKINQDFPGFISGQ